MDKTLFLIPLLVSLALALVLTSAWKAYGYRKSAPADRNGHHYAMWVTIIVGGCAISVLKMAFGIQWDSINALFSKDSIVKVGSSTVSVVDSFNSSGSRHNSAKPVIGFLYCWGRSPTVYCRFSLTAPAQLPGIVLIAVPSNFKMLDNLGHWHEATALQMGTGTSADSAHITLPPLTPIELVVSFPNVDKYANRVMAMKFKATLDERLWEHTFTQPVEISF